MVQGLLKDHWLTQGSRFIKIQYLYVRTWTIIILQQSGFTPTSNPLTADYDAWGAARLPRSPWRLPWQSTLWSPWWQPCAALPYCLSDWLGLQVLWLLIPLIKFKVSLSANTLAHNPRFCFTLNCMTGNLTLGASTFDGQSVWWLQILHAPHYFSFAASTHSSYLVLVAWCPPNDFRHLSYSLSYVSCIARILPPSCHLHE